MSEDSRNAIGRMCRWCLLAVVGLAIVPALAVATAAAVSLPKSAEARLCVPDALAREGYGLRVVVDFVPQLPSRLTGYMTLYGLAGTPRIPALMDGKDFRLSFKPQRMGVHDLDVSGMPYGGFSFLASRSQIVIVPADRPVYIVDALLVQNAPGAELRAALSARLDRAGTMAYIHPAPPEEYLRFRQKLRAGGDTHPVLCTNDLVAGAEMAIAYLGEALGLHTRGHAPTEIITGDLGLARLAARSGFTVRFIGASKPPIGTGYRTLEDYIASLGD